MIAIRSVLLAGCAAVALVALSPPAVAGDALPAAVRQQVDAGVSAWSATGNTGALGATVADLCNENPGVAVDIVAYAGEAAAREEAVEHCIVSSTECAELDELMALLYEQTIKVGGRGNLAAVTARSGSPSEAATPPSPSAGTQPVSPARESGPAAPLRDANAPRDVGPPLPCQASGMCGGEGPPASYTAL